MSAICRGSGEIFHDGDRPVDANGVTTCRVCRRHTLAEELAGSFSVRTHPPLRSRIVHARDEDGVPEDMDERTW